MKIMEKGIIECSNCLQTCWNMASNWTSAPAELIKERDLCTDKCFIVRCKELEWVWRAQSSLTAVGAIFAIAAIYCCAQWRTYAAKSINTLHRAETVQKASQERNKTLLVSALAIVSFFIAFQLSDTDPSFNFCNELTRKFTQLN